MNTVQMVTAEKILKAQAPEELFSFDSAAVKRQYHDMSKVWHPDLNGHKDAHVIFQRINFFYKEALKKIEAGVWEVEGMLTFRDAKGVLCSFSFQTKKSFELGVMYIGSHHVTYLIDPEHKDLFNAAVKACSDFRYGSKRMEDDIARCLPKDKSTFITADGKLGMQYVKTPDLLLLKDVIAHLGTNLNGRHIGWILNSMYNICCYFRYAGITHNDVSMDTYFISPKFHCGALLGGWWYSKQVESKLQKVPLRTFKLLPWEVQTKKIALHSTDLELVRAVGREIVELASTKGKGKYEVPAQMMLWFSGASSDQAVDEYKNWTEALKEAFGPKKFINMDVAESDLYTK